jgi:hypothetical protein
MSFSTIKGKLFLAATSLTHFKRASYSSKESKLELEQTNKIMFTNLMKKCIQLAKKAEGKVSPNPMVGSIVLDTCSV